MGISRSSYFSHKKAGTLDKASPRSPRVAVQVRSKAQERPEQVRDPDSTPRSTPRSTLAPAFAAKMWQPGQSGNPGGRQKQDKSVKLLARQYTAEAIKTLADVMRDAGAPTSARVGAAQVLLDRGHGKPLQQLEVGEAGAFADLEEAELDAAIAKMGEQLAMLTKDDDGEHVVH
jgi:hypothetical protein